MTEDIICLYECFLMLFSSSLESTSVDNAVSTGKYGFARQQILRRELGTLFHTEGRKIKTAHTGTRTRGDSLALSDSDLSDDPRESQTIKTT